jgi:predicted MPP superfamily phosphohydrolase
MPRGLILIPILLVFLGVLGGGHLYIADRLIYDLALPKPIERALTLLIVLLCVSLFLQPMAERLLPRRASRVFVWPASIWMGTAFFLLMGLFATDLLVFLLGFAAPPDPAAQAMTSRVRAVALLGLVLPAAVLAVRQGLAMPETLRIEIPLRRWPRALDGFRIVQISDIHFGPIRGRAFADWIVEQVAGLEPDLIAITGDLVDGSVAHIGEEVKPFAKLAAPHGVYFINGNHDHYSDADAWSKFVAELGISVLRNEHLVLDFESGPVQLAGVDDHRSTHLPGDQGEDLDAALMGTRPELPLILLAHDPTTFHAASKQNVDLQLSGHTHGGQIWPFHYFVRLAMPFVAGLHRRGEALLYVSSGTGFWGPPMRLGAPAEITELVLRSGAEEPATSH